MPLRRRTRWTPAPWLVAVVRAQASSSLSGLPTPTLLLPTARITTIYLTSATSAADPATATSAPVAADSSDRQLTTIALICTSVAVGLLLITAGAYRWTVVRRRRRATALLAGTVVTLPPPRTGPADMRSHSSSAGGKSDRSAATLAWLAGTSYAAPPDDHDDRDDALSSRPSWIGSTVSRDWRKLAKRAQRMLSTPSFVAKVSDKSPASRSRSSGTKRSTGSSLSPRSRRQTGLSFFAALRESDEDVPPVPAVPKLDLADIELDQAVQLADRPRDTHD